MRNDLQYSTIIMMVNALFYLFTILSLMAVNRKVFQLRDEMRGRQAMDKQLMETLKEVINKIK